MNDQNVTTKPEQAAALCSSDLLACPFCGGQADYGETADGGHYAACTDGMCGASSKLIYPDKTDPKPLVREAWNSRDDHAAAIGSKWKTNSSLEEWFPMTAEAIEEIRQVATGERQVGTDDTDGLDWIARRIAALSGAARDLQANTKLTDDHETKT